jgi:AcrR family transcriptional regulator
VQTRTEARRRAIVKAATDLFLEKGYERTSLDDILERSKGSRSTLYKLFGNKEGLLEAIIEETTGEVWATLSDWYGRNPPPTAENMVELGVLFFKAIMAPRALSLHRILVAEGPHIPEGTAQFMKRGPDRNRARLVQWFAEGRDAGHFKSYPPEALAETFMGLVLGDLHLRCMVGQGPVLDERAARSRIEIAVGIFLRGAQ